jgi:hypothetical protein
LWWPMQGPASSYSCLEINICWKVPSDARMDPPIHTECLRSGGAMTRTLTADGARAVTRTSTAGWHRKTLGQAQARPAAGAQPQAAP